MEIQDCFIGEPPELGLVRGHPMVRWVALGEGWNGDYDEDDPDDEALLRFDVLALNPQTGEWEEVASWCTRFPVETTEEQQRAGLEMIMDALWGALEEGRSLRTAEEEMSLISPK